jgi:hypothetical protein
MEEKIWTFRARFPRENRHFVPLNFPVIAPRRFCAIFEPPFRSTQSAPNTFANCARSRCKFAVRRVRQWLSRVGVNKIFMRIDSTMFSLSHWSRSRRGDERAGSARTRRGEVRVPETAPIAGGHGMCIFVHTTNSILAGRWYDFQP